MEPSPSPATILPCTIQDSGGVAQAQAASPIYPDGTHPGPWCPSPNLTPLDGKLDGSHGGPDLTEDPGISTFSPSGSAGNIGNAPAPSLHAVHTISPRPPTCPPSPTHSEYSPTPTCPPSPGASIALSGSKFDKPNEADLSNLQHTLVAIQNTMAQKAATESGADEGNSKDPLPTVLSPSPFLTPPPLIASPTRSEYSPTPTCPSSPSVLAAPPSIDLGQSALSNSQSTLDTARTGEPAEGGSQVAPPVATGSTADHKQDQGLDPAPFMFTQVQLASIVASKNIQALAQLGGPDGLLQGLGTSAERGLSTNANDTNADCTPSDHFACLATFDDRRRLFGHNHPPQQPGPGLLQLVWFALLKGGVLISLLLIQVLSLVLSFLHQISAPGEPGEPPEWAESVASVIIIFAGIFISSSGDWWKERQFKNLDKHKGAQWVRVIRDGRRTTIDVEHVLVGDIMLLERGGVIPCDGIFLSGHGIKCDESRATGESDAVRKISYNELLLMGGGDRDHTNCFVASGSMVLEGFGKYVVTGGMRSLGDCKIAHMHIPASTESHKPRPPQTDAQHTSPEFQRENFARANLKVAAAASVLVLVIQSIVQLAKHDLPRTAYQKGMVFVDILAISIQLFVTAVLEDLPRALIKASVIKRMVQDRLLARNLGSCEIATNASVFCVDKTGTLTQNSTTVIAGSIGIHAKFGRWNVDEDDEAHRNDFVINQARLNDALPPHLRELLNESIAINSTADKGETSEPIFVGSKIETALLQFSEEHGWRHFKEAREGATIVQMIPFSSDRRAMAVVIKLPKGGYRFYVKGASDILLRKCSHSVVVRRHCSLNVGATIPQRIDEHAWKNLDDTVAFYSRESLRTITLCYRDIPQSSLTGRSLERLVEVPYEELAQDLTLLSVIGIEDPLRAGVRDAVFRLQEAGTSVIMVTGDSMLTADSVAKRCGIYVAGGILMSGSTLPKLTQFETKLVLGSLQVMAMASPEEKRKLIDDLQAPGQAVAFCGDGTNDIPALKAARVSISIAGTEAAKQNSDIILTDNYFPSIITVIGRGHHLRDIFFKPLQYQITTAIAAVVITSITAITRTGGGLAISPVQLLWTIVVINTSMVLALAADPASENRLGHQPHNLFTNIFKMVLFQSAYQITIILSFYFVGHQILGYDNTVHGKLCMKTFVFSTFVFAQIFNAVNCRRLDRHLNVFIGRNLFFACVTITVLAIQVLVIFKGGAAFGVTSLTRRELGISLALGAMSAPWGICVRLMPNKPFEGLLRFSGLLGPEDNSPDIEQQDESISAIPLNLLPRPPTSPEIQHILDAYRAGDLQFHPDTGRHPLLSALQAG